MRDLSGDAGMFIRHVGGTFMPRFCIFFADGYFCVGARSQGISELKDKEVCACLMRLKWNCIFMVSVEPSIIVKP